MESIREKLESLLRSLASDALEEDENTASLSLCYLLRAFSGYGVKIVHSNLPS